MSNFIITNSQHGFTLNPSLEYNLYIHGNILQTSFFIGQHILNISFDDLEKKILNIISENGEYKFFMHEKSIRLVFKNEKF